MKHEIFQIIEEMEHHGTLFTQNLARAIRLADVTYKQRLLDMFTDLLSDYDTQLTLAEAERAVNGINETEPNAALHCAFCERSLRTMSGSNWLTRLNPGYLPEKWICQRCKLSSTPA